MRILVAEDNRVHRLLIERGLENGLLIDFVVNGEEALSYLNSEAEYADKPLPDIIVLDLNLPRLSGLEILKIIKQTPGVKLIPVFILTTSRQNQEIIESYDIGAAGYLIKPVDGTGWRDLLRAVPDLYEQVELPTRLE